MTITSECIQPNSRSGKITKESLSYSVTYNVETDDKSDSPVDIAADFTYSVGDSFEGYPVTDIAITESQEDGFSWDVAITYGGENTDNPLDEPASYSISYSPTEVPVDFDINGDAILNSAGDPFNEICFSEEFRPVISVTKNFATYPAGLAENADRTVNSAAFLGFAAGTVRFVGISGNSQYNETIGTYYSVTIEFAIQPTWKKQILNQGFRELDGGELVMIQLDGKDISQPVPLKADGTKLPGNRSRVLKNCGSVMPASTTKSVSTRT